MVGKRLYETLLQLITNQDISFSFPVSILFKNNLSMIYLQRCNYDLGVEQFQYLVVNTFKSHHFQFHILNRNHGGRAIYIISSARDNHR